MSSNYIRIFLKEYPESSQSDRERYYGSKFILGINKDEADLSKSEDTDFRLKAWGPAWN